MTTSEKRVFIGIVSVLILAALIVAGWETDVKSKMHILNKGTLENATKALSDAGFSEIEFVNEDFATRSDLYWAYVFDATNSKDEQVKVTVLHKYKEGYTVRFGL